jgi:hypothetical protein
MQYVLSLLPLLACPVGMGLLMWLLMRGTKKQAPGEADQAPVDTSSKSSEVTNESPKRGSMLSMLFMCLNWKVVAALAVVGLIVGVVAPRFLLGAIPLLILAACPLSMLFMMRSMQGGQSSPQPLQVGPSQIEGLTHEEQIATLKAQLASTGAHLEARERETAEQERSGESKQPRDEAVTYAGYKQNESRGVPK